MTRKLVIGPNAIAFMATSALVALGSVPAPKMDQPRLVQPAQKPRRQNANATRTIFGSKYPGQVMRDLNKAKGVGRPPKKGKHDEAT
jgi:hypothetical protein